MAEDRERIEFRLKHIIPRTLTPANYYKNGLMTVIDTSPDGLFQEVRLQMTWGKIAGKRLNFLLT